MNGPPRWREPAAEQFTLMDTAHNDMPTVLRSVADLLEADPALMLYALYNSPTEPEHPAQYVVQIVVSRMVPE